MHTTHGYRECLAVVLLSAALTSAGLTAPQVGYVYPAGGQRGTTFTVEVGGQALRNVDGARVSGTGVRVSVLEYSPTLDFRSLRKTRRFMRDLVRRRWRADVMAEARLQQGPPLPDHPWLRDIDNLSREELARLRTRFFDPKKQPNAQISEQVFLEVFIDKDAPIGDRELRVLTSEGLSNPICFQVGALGEVCENRFAGGKSAPVMQPPLLLNGQITPGDTDRIRLQATVGQQLVIRLQARRLVPYLADAVPGWFQAVMTLYSPTGEEVAWNDDYRFDPDPLIAYKVPASGIYELEIRDAIYRGRDDFVYRIAVGEMPLVKAAFPLGVRENVEETVSVTGWNLPQTKVGVDTRPGAYLRSTALAPESGGSAEIQYAVDDLPHAVETEPNGSAEKQMAVSLPVIINGRVGRPGDVDMFRFEGQAGQVVVAEVHARRLGSPLDSVVSLLGPEGKEIAINDDCKDPALGLVTHHSDSHVLVNLPVDGVYTVRLSDALGYGGEPYAYRLRIGPARPGFSLRLVPSCINVRAGGSAKATVHVLRREGFDGPIDVTQITAPEGFTMSGARIPAEESKGEVRFHAPREATRQVFPITVEGSSVIGGKTVRRPAVPAEDMMQAFLWRFLVPRQELLVAVTGPRPVPIVWQPLLPGIETSVTDQARLPLGGTATVHIKAPPMIPGTGPVPLSALQFRLGNRPRGVSLQKATVVADGIAVTLKADRYTAFPGDTANVIIRASTKSGTAGSVAQLGVLPAIPYEVVWPWEMKHKQEAQVMQ